MGLAPPGVAAADGINVSHRLLWMGGGVGAHVRDPDTALRTVKSKNRHKYVPGPIGALMDQAEVVGLQLAINQQDELEFRREGRDPIPLP